MSAATSKGKKTSDDYVPEILVDIEWISESGKNVELNSKRSDSLKEIEDADDA